MMRFDPEHYTRHGIFIPNELTDDFKALHTGKSLGGVLVELLRDFVIHQQLKQELKNLNQ
ncbi:hypothetical protein Psest_3148 [Stutzerimonas stutzeri RCH2]|jgi:hypothetical protein|uniref:Uncharacterized protein n=1 Tax=Stutzerimonas stutzeri RCH2 TaxID=644801 RepID=L0GQQ8_STUST|nr:hypothetical protein Psest_3148 [Stutzerimonas stutzeri RCH2]